MPAFLNHLAHLHLPSPVPYIHTIRLQEAILNHHWAYRDAQRFVTTTNTSRKPPSGPPPAALLTFSTLPTYTVGRRHLTDNPLSDSQIGFLTGTNLTSPSPNNNASSSRAAEFYPSPRGGLLTYHAPGQLTAYPIIDLRRFGLSARNYIRLLEDVVINTCGALSAGNVGRSCGDPGVWMLDEQTGRVTDRKICAVGVRVTRGVGSHGVGLNIFDAAIPARLKHAYQFQDPEGKSLPAGSNGNAEDSRGYLSWGFSRIVACGLEGKKTTWLTEEGADPGSDVDKVAKVFARELVEALNLQNKSAGKASSRLDGVEEISEDDILSEDKQP